MLSRSPCQNNAKHVNGTLANLQIGTRVSNSSMDNLIEFFQLHRNITGVGGDTWRGESIDNLLDCTKSFTAHFVVSVVHCPDNTGNQGDQEGQKGVGYVSFGNGSN